MKEVRAYVKQWIEIICSGKEFSGHGFMAGFPQPVKSQLQKTSIDALYYALDLIYKYHSKPDMSYYSFIDQEGKQPERLSFTTLTWNLLNALKICAADLKNSNSEK